MPAAVDTLNEIRRLSLTIVPVSDDLVLAAADFKMEYAISYATPSPRPWPTAPARPWSPVTPTSSCFGIASGSKSSTAASSTHCVDLRYTSFQFL